MKELVYKTEKGTPVTDSVKVAEVFGKEHRNLIRAIRNILGVSSNLSAPKWFYETTYLDTQGKPRPMFIMNRDGFSLLAMGLTGAKAMQFKVGFIEQFNKMEEIVKRVVRKEQPTLPQNFAEALRLAADQAEKIQQQQAVIEQTNRQVVQLSQENEKLSQENEKLQKDSDYLSLILTSDSSIAVTQIAQDYGMSAKAFNQQLHTMRIQHKVNGQWILYAPHQGKSYIKSRTIDFLNSKGERKTRIHTEWTQRGRIFLYHALAEIGILPLIEQAA